MSSESYPSRVSLSVLMRDVEPGDPHSWAAEFEWLRENDGAQMRSLISSVLRVGIRHPVLVGNDGRLWDGHHRVFAAWAPCLSEIPVEYARDAR